jgi:hypothetical protein
MLVGFFKNIFAEITGGNKEVSKAVDSPFKAKWKTCGTCFSYECDCDHGVALPVADDSTKRILYVVNNQLFFGTMENLKTVRAGGANGGTRLDA